MISKDFPRYAFVIFGMHRSGTSALAGVLSRFGADLPRNQMRPTDDNPAGYFESTPVKVLNERILDSAGTAWDDWTGISETWFSGPRAAALKVDAKAVLTEEFGTSPLFVFKDPRVCRLWPFWHEVLQDMGVTPIPILMLRHPEEVAASLLRRDKLPLSLGRLVWLRHLLDAERFTRGSARVIVRYDQLLADRGPLLEDLEKVTGFAMPRRSDEVDAQVQRFIDPQLRHFAQSAGPEAEQSVFDEAYRLLQAKDASGAARLDAIRQMLDTLSGMVYGLAGPAREMARELNRVSAQRDALQQREQDLVMERDVLGELVTEKKVLVEAAIAGRDQMAAELGRAVAERDAAQRKERELAAELAKVSAERDAAQAAERELAAGLAKVSAERDAAQAAERALASGKTALTEAARLAGEKAARDSAAHAETIKRLQTEVKSMQVEMGRWAEIAAKREAALVQRNRDEVAQERQRIQAEFYNSRSWKLTAPVRWVSQTARGKAPS